MIIYGTFEGDSRIFLYLPLQLINKEPKYNFLAAIASPSTYPCQSVGHSVSDRFRFGDSYRIFELGELVCSPSACSAQQRLLQDPCFRIDCKSVTLCMAFILENSPNSWQKIMRYFSLWQKSAYYICTRMMGNYDIS